MQRRDLALAIAIGLLLGALVAFGYAPEPIAAAAALAFRFWFVGVAAVIVAAFLGGRRISSTAPRVIGFAGMLWVAFLVGVPLTFLIGSIIGGPQGR